MSAVASSQHDLDDLVLELKGLVYARAILEGRAASAEAIRIHELEIDRVRSRLAEVARLRAA